MRKVYFIGGVVCALLCVVCIILALPTRTEALPDVLQATAEVVRERNASQVAASEPEASGTTPPIKIEADTPPPGTELEDSDPVEDEAIESEPEAPPVQEKAPYVSPLDFDTIRAQNSDIYAWLYVADTNINYPVLQAVGKRADYYNYYTVKGRKGAGGAIYSEYSFNAQDFQDPVTIIYGHNMKNGTMFGSVQKIYASVNGLEEHKEIVAYTADGEFHYEIFASVPFSNTHLFYRYNWFETTADVEAFLDDVYAVHAFGAVYSETAERPEPGTRLLVLETCLQRNPKQRYIVVAKLVDEL